MAFDDQNHIIRLQIFNHTQLHLFTNHDMPQKDYKFVGMHDIYSNINNIDFVRVAITLGTCNVIIEMT